MWHALYEPVCLHVAREPIMLIRETFPGLTPRAHISALQIAPGKNEQFWIGLFSVPANTVCGTKIEAEPRIGNKN